MQQQHYNLPGGQEIGVTHSTGRHAVPTREVPPPLGSWRKTEFADSRRPRAARRLAIYRGATDPVRGLAAPCSRVVSAGRVPRVIYGIEGGLRHGGVRFPLKPRGATLAGGVEPAWTLLTIESMNALRREPATIGHSRRAVRQTGIEKMFVVGEGTNQRRVNETRRQPLRASP